MGSDILKKIIFLSKDYDYNIKNYEFTVSPLSKKTHELFYNNNVENNSKLLDHQKYIKQLEDENKDLKNKLKILKEKLQELLKD